MVNFHWTKCWPYKRARLCCRSVPNADKGREEVQNPENFADVIYGRSLVDLTDEEREHLRAGRVTLEEVHRACMDLGRILSAAIYKWRLSPPPPPEVRQTRYTIIFMCIGLNQKIQPNFDLYLIRKYKICHFPMVGSYLFIGQSLKIQPNLDLYLVRRYKICHFPMVVSYFCIGQSLKNQPNLVQGSVV